MKGRGMIKAKKWKIAIIVLLGLVATVLIAIGEGRFWKYQENYIPDGTYQMIKYEDKSAYSNELRSEERRVGKECRICRSRDPT